MHTHTRKINACKRFFFPFQKETTVLKYRTGTTSGAGLYGVVSRIIQAVRLVTTHCAMKPTTTTARALSIVSYAVATLKLFTPVFMRLFDVRYAARTGNKHQAAGVPTQCIQERSGSIAFYRR